MNACTIVKYNRVYQISRPSYVTIQKLPHDIIYAPGAPGWTHVSSAVATATTGAATASAIVLLLSMNVAYVEVMAVFVVLRAFSGRRPDHCQSCAFRPSSCLQS